MNSVVNKQRLKASWCRGNRSYVFDLSIRRFRSPFKIRSFSSRKYCSLRDEVAVVPFGANIHVLRVKCLLILKRLVAKFGHQYGFGRSSVYALHLQSFSTFVKKCSIFRLYRIRKLKCLDLLQNHLQTHFQN